MSTTKDDGAVETTVAAEEGLAPHEVHRLKPGTIGLWAVLFIALANAAPITAMTGNVPIAIGYGNGLGAPAGFFFATVILTIFAIGYVTMAKHITTTGAFYGFISHGLGKVAGMGAGLMATLAYIVFEASLIGILASFTKSTIETFGGPEISWLVYALIGIAIIAALGYFEISLSGKVLGVFLVAEVIILAALAIAILVRGGGPSGLEAGALNPVNAFSAVASDPQAAITGSAAIGLFFAFWSWVGFETTAVYGEESKDPKKIVPRATMIAVIGLGLFYVFVSWMAIAGNGLDNAIAISRGSTGNAFDLFYGITDQFLAGWVKDVYLVLVVTGSFACALAFHNAASRYLYALGRDGVSSRLQRTLGSTHGKHGSPHIASVVQSVIALVITLGFFLLQKPTDAAPDVAYIHQYGLMALMGTMALLIVQSICSIAVIWYFHVRKQHPETASWWRTFLAPLVGAIGMLYVVYLLFSNIDFAAGAAAGSPVFKATPYVVLGIGVIGVIGALVLKYRSPERYERIGSTVMSESHER
ncbi:APC family permease [Cryptosporangium aurantiacum]|uniref:Amino acid/polyamine/organocation transporter, APC superfamily n=1 Tax=Cryptosporangium aurantiacum TaxID=134849 RepID=A0A1M7QDP7_9ACTN|nr:APC family permease [Cryptosporangium aurantiacum]SHN28788.1 amino acid/polyamine/organocation transporter, APC superfamily [Cryptosporangium aurantiacum]